MLTIVKAICWSLCQISLGIIHRDSWKPDVCLSWCNFQIGLCSMEDWEGISRSSLYTFQDTLQTILKCSSVCHIASLHYPYLALPHHTWAWTAHQSHEVSFSWLSQLCQDHQCNYECLELHLCRWDLQVPHWSHLRSLTASMMQPHEVSSFSCLKVHSLERKYLIQTYLNDQFFLPLEACLK